MPKSSTNKLIASAKKNFFPNYNPREVVLSHGMGSTLYDDEGNNYIDLGTGISVNSLGHQHPDLTRALVNQMRMLWHTSNIFYNEPSIRLAEELVDCSFAEAVYFCNSGSEANETAIKLARKVASKSKVANKNQIITFQGSFHGRTLAAVTATAQEKYHEGFSPLPSGFSYCEFNNQKMIEEMMNEKVCAVIVEPIQGEGGVHSVELGFLQLLRELCDRYQSLLVFDEVQTGMGRTGRLFAHQWYEVQPDVMTLAKALGGGLPIGAVLATSESAKVLTVGSHGSTFGGNPLVCAVAREVLASINQPHLIDNVNRQGENLRRHLLSMKEQGALFKEIRGKGLMVGLELKGKWKGQSAQLSEHCRQAGVIVLQAGVDVMRFLPPLNIDHATLRKGLHRFEQALADF